MKRSKEKGISLITLVVTIIVIIIIASVGIYTGTDIIKRANLQNINTNMMLIQAKVKTISEQAKFNKNTSNYKGTKISDITGNEKIDELVTKTIIDNEEDYYLLSQTDLNEMGLEKISVDDGYIVNYDSNEVIYVKGFEANEQLYYELTEMKNLTIE